MKVVQLENSHLDGCSKIIAQTQLFSEVYGYSGEKARQQLEDGLKTGSDEFLAVMNGQEIMGFAWFVKKGAFARSGYLRLIVVHPKHLKQGVGQALMAELERKYLNPHGLFLLVTSTNLSARKFYERLGYRQVGELPDYVKKGVSEAIYFRAALS